MLQITITNDEYQRLLKNSIELECLISIGVDNWEGFEDAMKMAEELKREIKETSVKTERSLT